MVQTSHTRTAFKTTHSHVNSYMVLPTGEGIIEIKLNKTKMYYH